MKFKRIICCLASISIIASSLAFAAGTKINTKLKGSVATALSENDLVYDTFTDVEEGEAPKGWVLDNSNGYTDTVVEDNGKGVKKNMLRIVDTTYDDSWVGPKAFRPLPEGVDSGILKYEVRYKYIPDGGSDHSIMNFQVKNAAGKNIATGYIPKSATAAFAVRDTSSAIVNTMKVTAEEWHKITYYIDFDNGVYDAMIVNEKSGSSATKYDLRFATDTKTDKATQVAFSGECYGGIYFVDYVRVSKTTMRLEDEIAASIKDEDKGFPAEMIDGPKNNAIAKRVNIKYNDRYMFTTKAPVISGEEVLVTAKNLATMFNMAYQRSVDGYTIKNAANEITFAVDGASAKKNGDKLELSAACKIKDTQIFVPVSDVAKALGLSYSFDKENNEVVITGKIETKAAETKADAE